MIPIDSIVIISNMLCLWHCQKPNFPSSSTNIDVKPNNSRTSPTLYSKRRFRINQKLFKVRLPQKISTCLPSPFTQYQTYLEPSPRLRCRLQRIAVSTMRIKPGCRAIRCAIALATGLNPDKRISERVARVGRKALAEAGADNVAPVAPGVLLSGLDAVAS